MLFAAIKQAHCVNTYVMYFTPFTVQIRDLMLLHKSFFRFTCIHIFQFVCTNASTFALGRGKWLRKNEQSPIRCGLDQRRQAVNIQTKCICHLPGLQLGPGPIESNEKNALPKRKYSTIWPRRKTVFCPLMQARARQIKTKQAAPRRHHKTETEIGSCNCARNRPK